MIRLTIDGEIWEINVEYGTWRRVTESEAAE